MSPLLPRAGVFVVGPESTGASPGPVCYKKGGQLAITDANLALGRILPDYFPQVGGPREMCFCGLQPVECSACDAPCCTSVASQSRILPDYFPKVGGGFRSVMVHIPKVLKV